MRTIWPSGKNPTTATSELEENLWQECLIAFGRCLSTSEVAGKHFMKVIEFSYDVNTVPYPYKMFRVGFPKPIPPMVEPEGGAVDMNTCRFLLPGLGGSNVEATWSSDERELGQKWLKGLAESVHDLRDSMHVDTKCFDTTLLPWPMVPISCIADDECVHPDNMEDPLFYESGRYLCDCKYHDPQQLDLSLTEWRVLPENVIKDDTCTEKQLKLLELRAKRGPVSETMIEKRRINVDPRFFEEVRPTLEKEAALAECHARWARDKATAIQDHDKAADYGAQFVAWPLANERCWPKPSRVWLNHGRWFTMWRNSQRAKQASARKLRAEKRKLRAERHNEEGSSCAASDASWEVLSECSDSSWQAVSEVSDMSWLELASEADIVAHMNEKVSAMAKLRDDCQKDLDLVIPALEASYAALQCLSKGDIVELKAMKKPPSGIILVAEAMCYCFSLPTKGRDAKSKSKCDFWQVFQKLLSDVAFLSRLLHYDKDNISEQILRNLQPFESDPQFQPEVIGKASLAAKGLCMWVRGIIVYAQIAKLIAPKKETLRQAQLELAIAEQALASRTQKEALNETTEDHISEGHEALSIEERANNSLEVAAEALMSVDKKDLSEIKSFCSPPQPVMTVCQCIAILRPLGNEDASAGWAGAKAMLSDANLLRAMHEYNKEKLSEKQVNRVRELLSKEKQLFEGDRMKCVSKAAYGLLQWVKAMVAYYDASEFARRKGNQVECIEALSPCSTEVPSPASAFSGVNPLDISLEMEPEPQKDSLPVVALASLRELKCFSKPPAEIITLLSAIMELLAGISSRIALDEEGGVKDVSWKASQKYLCDPSQLIQDLKVFEDTLKAGKVPRANIENALIQMQSPQATLNLESCMKKKSAAAAGLAQWLAAVLTHYDLQ